MPLNAALARGLQQVVERANPPRANGCSLYFCAYYFAAHAANRASTAARSSAGEKGGRAGDGLIPDFLLI